MTAARVIGAAILVDGEVYSVSRPGRHRDVIRLYAKDRGQRLPAGAIQGFLTDSGFFVGRVQAARLAFESGQIASPKAELFTEDLW